MKAQLIVDKDGFPSEKCEGCRWCYYCDLCNMFHCEREMFNVDYERETIIGDQAAVAE